MTNMTCPRCQAKENDLRVEHQGVESVKVIWTVYYCSRCAFTWRDSEAQQSIDYEKRDRWFRVEPDEPEKYPYNIPPAKNP